jgi:hypothetical protein
MSYLSIIGHNDGTQEDDSDNPATILTNPKKMYISVTFRLYAKNGSSAKVE